jgi:cytochrome c oxidase subunit 1
MAYADDFQHMGTAHHEPHSFLTKYVWSQDHKVIAVQYACTAILVGLVGVVLSNLMRLQLGYPGRLEFIDPQSNYQ